MALAYDDAMVYVALRRKGRKLAEAWTEQDQGLDQLRTALLDARGRLMQPEQPDTVELVIAHGFEPVPYDQRAAAFSNLQRGIRGIELRSSSAVSRHGPTEMIASNRSFERILQRFVEQQGLSGSDLSNSLALRRFAADQFLVSLGPAPAAVRLFRGKRLIEPDAVTREAVAALGQRLALWMVRNVRTDGRITYKYWPSSGRASSANNMIRQWMATLALIRLARWDEGPALPALIDRNIRYNLRHFYRESDGLGLIEFDDKVKLGAVALAALAIAEHRNRADFRAQELALRRTIEQLWAADGSFRTFFKPAERNDNQNFYPGEALLYLASLYRESGNDALRQRLMRSFRHYQDWHRAERNPAFVPWHSMTYSVLWQETGDPALRDWIFEMNDWLLGMQQRAPGAYPDIDGRFYDPDRPHFGPPHASSTAVYLEGLVEAFRLARATGDADRSEAYRLSILRGLRSLMQLQFGDETDMYYVSKRERVGGGLRTTVYDNEIRVDNVQHALMAVLEILTVFRDSDFRQ